MVQCCPTTVAGVEPLPASRRALVTIAVVSAFAFAVLAVAIAIHPAPTGLEAAVDRALLVPRDSRAFHLFKAITETGSVLVVAIAVAVLAVECWMTVGDRRLAVASVVAVAVAGIAVALLKPLVGRPRPPTSVFSGESGFGFPSGHTTGATALAICAVAVLLRVNHTQHARRALVAIAVGYAAIVGVSRVALGAHRAFDVVGGWLLGSAIAIVILVTIEAGPFLHRLLHRRVDDHEDTEHEAVDRERGERAGPEVPLEEPDGEIRRDPGREASDEHLAADVIAVAPE